MIHSFAESLALSHAHDDSPWWAEVYSVAFPGFAGMVSVRNDGWAQRGGIDRVITLKSGRVVTVDEKVRSQSYGDILLERWSARERKAEGWIQKDLACDYIAYRPPLHRQAGDRALPGGAGWLCRSEARGRGDGR